MQLGLQALFICNKMNINNHKISFLMKIYSPKKLNEVLYETERAEVKNSF